jgi:integrase/recombinase XerD
MAGNNYGPVHENRHDAVNDFLQRKADLGRSERTLTTYSRNLREFFHDEFPTLTPDEVRVQHMEEYVGSLTARGLAQNTKRRYLESLSAFYSWAMKRPRFDGITGNPAAVVLEELSYVAPDRPDCATWSNAEAIVHELGDPREKTVAILMAKTGVRVTEALSLAVDDLMLDEGFIRFRDRKGGTDTVFPIDTETKEAVERFRLVRDAPDEDALFVSIQGGEIDREQIRRAVRGAAVDAGIMAEGETRFAKKFTPHTFRTVFTTVMRNEGMPDHILRYLRGDADSEAMDVYTRVDRETAREAYLNCVKSLSL